MNKTKNKAKKNILSPFIKLEIFIGISTLFFVLLFNYLGGIYNALNYKSTSSSLNNLTEKTAIQLQDKIKESLEDYHFKNILFKYGVFFYVEDYSKRIAFIDSEKSIILRKSTYVNSDSFYTEMLDNHKKDLCFVKNTLDILPSNNIYESLSTRKERKEDIFYISCPLYLENSLVGYIGGLYKQIKDPIFIDIVPIKDSATLIEGVLLKN